MKMFIKSMDEDSWRTILTGWTRPVAKIREGVEYEKHEENWSKKEQTVANTNSKALNAIFNAVDTNQFKLISGCECAKRAWDILQTAYEGTTSVRLSKLQMLATHFEDLRMNEDETVADFNSKLCDIANEAHGLGVTYPEEKLVRKVLRSLPDRFAYKITAIEEANNVDEIHLEELIGNLQTFENKLSMSKMDKEINLALQSTNVPTSVVPTTVVSTPVVPTVSAIEVELIKLMARIAENFDKMVKVNENHSKADTRLKKRRIQCEKCQGFGHTHYECTNRLKKRGKSVTTAKSDDMKDSNEEEDKKDGNLICGTSTIVQPIAEATVPVQTSVRYEHSLSDHLISLNSSLNTGETSLDDEEEITAEMIQQQQDELLKTCLAVDEMNKALKTQVAELEKDKEVDPKNTFVKKTDCPNNSHVLTNQKFSRKTNGKSGCSNYITGNPKHLKDYQKCASGHATLSDGTKKQIPLDLIPCVNRLELDVFINEQ
ncbi:PREDICTED: uncharacterized protein LOC105966726 [Erythranthe guttata]|uniref:uncharacterized protein LOC105966726 n=1 Tax=Erythranthe guttata TaxID=4155 RepID=UPI00064DA811|nr:PREDICTED: uncharacterized protein LOC105966726 [Erythranthe guttata]|eukprot:XP_012846764.1 PREDICTED: uncharacterized protein LOC105966726 [Erythranthe guttata]